MTYGFAPRFGDIVRSKATGTVGLLLGRLDPRERQTDTTVWTAMILLDPDPGPGGWLLGKVVTIRPGHNDIEVIGHGPNPDL